jgi:hypothetical protein
MQPIAPPSIIAQGIALYCTQTSGLLELRIYYQAQNPKFNWIRCDRSEQLLWSAAQRPSNGGLIFHYPSRSLLEAGYYRLELRQTEEVQKKEGNATVTILQPTKRLIIGLPYSIYPPIHLT